MGDLRRENMRCSLKWRICEEKTRDFRLHEGFAKRKHVIFELNGGFSKRKRGFRLNGGFSKRKRGFRLNGGFAKRKHVIFA